MKMHTKDYVTIDPCETGSYCDCEVSQLEEYAEVVYRLASVAEDTCLLSGHDVPVSLVVARSKTARIVLPLISQEGLVTCIGYTQDTRFENHIKLADCSISLGEKYSNALFSNAYAVLNAAQLCEASVIFLCDESMALSEVDVFLARAAAQGVKVYRPLESQNVMLGWVACTTEKCLSDKAQWQACPRCSLYFDEVSVAGSHYICPECGSYMRMSAAQRLNDVLDEGSFIEWNSVFPTSDPLEFPGYAEKITALQEKTQLEEAVCTGEGSLAGLKVAIGVMDSRFLMGSMGGVVGEKITRLVERATDENLPVIIFTASGGARMQEGLVSLMQMAKVSFALESHAQAHLPYISVLTDPTTGGVTASFAMQGDIVVAEPRALIGFAGQRVIKDTIKQNLPEGFQTAEFALEHGLIDTVVPRENMRSVLAQLVALHLSTSSQGARHGCQEEGNRELCISYRAVCDNLERGTRTYNAVTYGDLKCECRYLSDDEVLSTNFRERFAGMIKRSKLFKSPRYAHLRQMSHRPCFTAEEAGCMGLDSNEEMPNQDERMGRNASAWTHVQLARNTQRPTSIAYISSFVDGFVELHGDRSFGDDAALICGLGWIEGRAVTIIAQEKGATLKERIRRTFGCPQPEGYRKSLRLMKQAEKFGRPIVCLVDTQGAFCGMQAEERGQGNAIAENLIGMAGLRVPVVSILLGEGGSGGALALAVGDRVAMQENAVYSVLSPEGFASILWKDQTRASEAAAVMRMTAHEVYELGVIDEVISEGAGPAHENIPEAIELVRVYLAETLDELSELSTEDLLARRYQRFRKF